MLFEEGGQLPTFTNNNYASKKHYFYNEIWNAHPLYPFPSDCKYKHSLASENYNVIPAEAGIYRVSNRIHTIIRRGCACKIEGFEYTEDNLYNDQGYEKRI